MKNKEQYDQLLLIITEENRIHNAYPNLKGTQKKIADARLNYISDFKKTFSFYEVECIDEMLKPVVDRKKIIELMERQIDIKKKKRQVIERMNRIAEKEDADRKFKAEYEEAVFIAWFLTAIIKQKVFFYDDLDALMLYEALKAFLAPERPSTAFNI